MSCCRGSPVSMEDFTCFWSYISVFTGPHSLTNAVIFIINDIDIVRASVLCTLQQVIGGAVLRQRAVYRFVYKDRHTRFIAPIRNHLRIWYYHCPEFILLQGETLIIFKGLHDGQRAALDFCLYSWVYSKGMNYKAGWSHDSFTAIILFWRKQGTDSWTLRDLVRIFNLSEISGRPYRNIMGYFCWSLSSVD